MGPYWFGAFIDQSASNSFEEVLPFHEMLAYRVVGDVAIESSLALGLLNRAEGDMS